MLVDGPPQPVALALDLQQHLIQVPFITRVCAPAAQSRSTAWAELCAPRTDRLVGDRHSPFGQELLDIAQAQVEAELEPNGMADDLGRVAITSVRRQLGRSAG